MENEFDDIESGKLEWTNVIDGFYKKFEVTLSAAEQSLDGTRVKVPEIESEEVCEKCGRKMVVKTGRFGKFLACPGYPECKSTKPITVNLPGSCPKCGKKLVQCTSKKGHKFIACEGGRECGFMTWDDPTAELCPQCGSTLFKHRGGVMLCLKDGCGFERKSERRQKKSGESK